MKTLPLTVVLLSGLGLQAQNDAFLPSDHASFEGSSFERRLPFSSGATAHVMFIYEGIDLQIPDGKLITHLGFRQETGIPSLGTTLDLQIFVGETTMTAENASNNFANNQTSPPIEVFTRKSFRLPDLGNPLNPNINAPYVIIPLDVPFRYTAGSNLAVEYKVFSNGLGTSFNYQIDKGTYRSSNGTIGQGCTGSNNRVPKLTGRTNNASVPGPWTLNFSLGTPNSIAVLGISAGQTPANPVLGLLGATGCDLFIDLSTTAFVTTLTDAGGRFNMTLQIPNNPAFNDAVLYAQTIVFDMASAGGLTASNAYFTELGMTPRVTTISTTSLVSATGAVSRNNGIVSLFRYQ